MTTSKDVLRIAAGEIGYSRWHDKEQGTKYGRWFAKKTKQSYYGASGVPYCAMFVSWVLDKAGVQVTGFPSAYCPSILAAGRNANLTLSNKKNAQAGDIVLFDWDGGVVDHVGIVEKNYGDYVQTIEGNTSSGALGSQDNGGKVARRTRSWNVVRAIIRPKYANIQNVKVHKDGVLTVDGVLGVQSVTRMQKVLNTQQTGSIQGQYKEYVRYYPSLTAVTFEKSGCATIRQLQKALKVHVDGVLGPQTIKALQKMLGVTIDGVLGAQTAKAVQSKLNKDVLW